MAEATLEAPPQTADAASVQGDEPKVRLEEQEFESAEDFVKALTERKESKKSKKAKASEEVVSQQTTPLQEPRAGQYIQQFRGAHETRQRQIDETVNQLAEYVPEPILKAVRSELKSNLNSHHSDSLRLAGYDSAATAVQYEQSHIQDAIVQLLPPKQLEELNRAMNAEIAAKGVASYASIFKTMQKLSRVGYVDDDTYQKDLARAFKAGQNSGKKNAGTVDTSNRAAGKVVSIGTGTSSGRKPTTLLEAYSLHARGDISNEQMRAYKNTLS